ncbi:MAG: DUF4153 domain-containing protein [Synergistaceae bacterium]|nr:DUF4153 domain-containing protein [Synergistaceae bacterium]
MNIIDRKRYTWVVISAVIQGLLLGMYAVLPSGPLLCIPLTVIFLVPFVFWLSQEHWGRRLVNFLLGLTVVLSALWAYRLWSLYSHETGFYFIPSQRSELIRVSMAVFLIIPFFQCRIAAWSWKFPYSEIFFQFCRNLFLLFQAGIVIAVFWGLLVTASLLFDIVGLQNVPFLIFNPLTSVPLTSLTIAISISVAIKHPGIDSLGRWILSVLAWLLPFFSVLSVMFILCLPFSGLRKLWDTGQASTLMLLLQFGTIILANAAWLDGTKPVFQNKYGNFLARLSLLCLPVYTSLCLYSVGLRIQQYGLTTDRIQAMFLAITAGIWGLGYAGAVVFKKWPGSIGRVNITSIIIMIILVVLMDSPLLDPYRLASENQYHRLMTGRINASDFDYVYTRFNLGRYGNAVLGELEAGDSEQVKAGIKAARSIQPEEYLRYTLTGIPPKLRRQAIISGAKVYPAGRELTAEQAEYFAEHWEYFKDVQRPQDLVFVFADVERSGHDVIVLTEEGGLVYNVDGTPRPLGAVSGKFRSLENPDVRTLEPRYYDLSINGVVFQVIE